MLRRQRSRAICVEEPDHETDLGGRRNHPLLRWREHARKPHARCESSFLPIGAGAFLRRKEEEHRSIGRDILSTTCAGLDGHKKTVVACVLRQASNGSLQKELRTYFTTTDEVLKLSDWLTEQGCTHVAEDRHRGVLETGVSPEGSAPLKCSSSMRSLSKPSLGERRMSKTLWWMADLLQHGLLKASCIPSGPQRELRDLTWLTPALDSGEGKTRSIGFRRPCKIAI
jgi:hypothetical protein